MSNDTTDDFRQKLKNFAEDVLKKRSSCADEAKTIKYMIDPFFQLLGYDTTDPNEVNPEYSTVTLDKKTGRIDYVLFKNKTPVLAVECKPRDCNLKTKRIQLCRYFVDIRSKLSDSNVLIGVLTNGVIYEFYTDTQKPNLMDSEPFLKLNLDNIAKGQISEFMLRALQRLRKSTLALEELKEEAVKKFSLEEFVGQIKDLFEEPSEEFVCFLLKEQKNRKEPTEEEVGKAYSLVQKALDIVLPQLAKASLVSGNSEEDEVNLDSVEEDMELKDVRVNGRFFSSTRVAFRENGLPDSKHREFRKELKKEGSRVYEKANGEKLCFETGEAIALKRLVSQGLCSVGTLVFDKDHCYQAKITDRGTLQILDEQEGVPSSLAGQLLKRTSYDIRKAWDFWRVNYEGQEISLSDLRAIAAESLKKI